jgi:hypothetical protein
LSLGFDMDAWSGLGAEALLEPYLRTCTEDAFPYAEALRLQNLYGVAFFQMTLGDAPEYGWWLTPEAAADEVAVRLWSRSPPSAGTRAGRAHRMPGNVW